MILADEPTQGVDVGSRFDIYEALRAKAAEGAALIVKSSDPIELSGLCDRVIVISRGRIVDEIPQADLERAAHHRGDRRVRATAAVAARRTVSEAAAARPASASGASHSAAGCRSR